MGIAKKTSARGRLPRAKRSTLESQTSSGNCLKITLKSKLKQRGCENALSSDFVKHSSKFEGSRVDFGRHFEGAFETKKAREASLEAGF